MEQITSGSEEEWIKICECRKREETCSEVGTAVPSHVYIAVRKSDDRIIGVIDLRHHGLLCNKMEGLEYFILTM